MKSDYADNKKYNPDLIENRFQVMEKRVDNLKSRVDDLGKINNVLIELKHLSQQQADMIERLFIGQEEQSEKINDVIGKTSQLGYRVGNSEEVIENINERICKEERRGVIHVSELVRNGIMMALGAILAAVIAMVV